MALVIGHRIAAGLAAENSLEGMSAAKLCRADYVHMDVRLSRDGKLVLMHDESVDRTTDGKGRIEDLDCMQIKAMHAGNGPVPLHAQPGQATQNFSRQPGDERLTVGEIRVI